MENHVDYTVRAVAFKNGQNWVAQCLEYDIATQAKTLDALLYELERIVVAHLFVTDGEDSPFAGLPKAPKRFWEMYRNARSKVHPVADPKLPIPPNRRPVMEVAFPEAA
jgi:hypothetical protein